MLLTRVYGPGRAPGRLGHASPPMAIYDMPCGTLLTVHRDTDAWFLPPRQGLGLARKVGTDMVLALHAAGRVASPWIGGTDADAVLPPDYFTQMRGLPDDAAAAVFRFYHRAESDPAHHAAIVHYEAALRYYVRGLRWAGSPYAYHTVGSTLAVHARAYAQVRGFPRLLAAEDFYLLDKLRKVGAVVSLAGHAVGLSARTSSRVPFGTGRAMLRAIQEQDAPPVYHPHIFIYLRAYLNWLMQCAEAPDSFLSCTSPVDAAVMADVIEHLGSREAIARAHAGPRHVAPRRRFLHTWFDAFRTLKLVHRLRACALPSVPLCEAVTRAPFSLAASAPREILQRLARDERAGVFTARWTN